MGNTINTAKPAEFKKFINSKENYDKLVFQNKDSIFSYANGANATPAVKEIGKSFTGSYDKNKDGKIDLAEFKATEQADYEKMFPNEPMDAGTKAQIDEMYGVSFKTLDTDGNNKVDEKEMTAYVALIDAQDNGQIDGQISYKNFAGVSSQLGSNDSGLKAGLQGFKDKLFGNK